MINKTSAARRWRADRSNDVVAKISSELEDVLPFLPRDIVVELINMVERPAGHACGRANEWPRGHYDVWEIRHCRVSDHIAGRLMVVGDAEFIQESR